MIEIQIEAVFRFLAGIAICFFGFAAWVCLWVVLAYVFEYPKNPSWKTAVPAAVFVLLSLLFCVLCITKVIVFV